MNKKENEFYLRDTRGNVGTSCMFWGKGGRGYVSDLSKAEVFNFDDAQDHADRKDHFIPLSKSRVDAVAVLRVDMQYLKLSTDFSEGIVIQVWPGSYDGNDIYFYNAKDKPSPDYNESMVILIDDVEKLDIGSGAIHSKKFTDTICRKVLRTGDVNQRKMMTSAGIRYRSPKKRKNITGKSRGNCPVCGKITWDYNPYENAYCEDHEAV